MRCRLRRVGDSRGEKKGEAMKNLPLCPMCRSTSWGTALGYCDCCGECGFCAERKHVIEIAEAMAKARAWDRCCRHQELWGQSRGEIHAEERKRIGLT